MLEVRLLHHYLTVTCETLVMKTPDIQHFQILAPRLATSHSYLLDSILALSALHLAFLEPHQSRPWLHAALKYQNHAVSGFNKALANMSPENCKPAFFCSIFTMLFTTAFPGISQDSQLVDPLSEVFQLRTLVAGCMILFIQLAENDTTGDMKTWMHIVLPEERLDEERAFLITKTDPKLVKIHGSILDSLDRLRTMIDGSVATHQDIYKNTWYLLYDTVERWPILSPKGGIVAWPVNISESFFCLLKGGDWIARMIFLHYCVAMHLISDKWFARDSGRRLVSSFLNRLEGYPPAWAETIAWAKQAVEINS